MYEDRKSPTDTPACLLINRALKPEMIFIALQTARGANPGIGLASSFPGDILE